MMLESQWIRISMRAAIKAAVPGVEVWEEPAPDGDSITFNCADASDDNSGAGHRYMTRFQIDVFGHGAMADTWAVAIDTCLHKWTYADGDYRVNSLRINARRGYDYLPNGERQLYSGGTYEMIVQRME